MPLINDPNNIMGGPLSFNPANWGGYAPAIQSVIDLLQSGPNLPAIAQAQTTTGAVDPAGQAYQSNLQGLGSQMASRGLTGSGIQSNAISSMLGNLQGTEGQAGQAGLAAGQQVRNQMQDQILQTLTNIANARAGTQFGLQQGRIAGAEAQNQFQTLQQTWPFIASQGNILRAQWPLIASQGNLVNAQWPILGTQAGFQNQMWPILLQELGLARQGANLSGTLANNQFISSILGSGITGANNFLFPQQAQQGTT